MQKCIYIIDGVMIVAGLHINVKFQGTKSKILSVNWLRWSSSSLLHFVKSHLSLIS